MAYRIYVVLFTLWTVLYQAQGLTAPNVMIALKYVQFSNPSGTTADGECCDELGKSAGTCSIDKCDVVFIPCVSRSPTHGIECNLVKHQPTPSIYNNNTFEVSKEIGNGVNQTFNLFVTKFDYNPNPVNYSIQMNEVPEEFDTTNIEEKEMASFELTVDWLDPKFDRNPTFKRFTLKYKDKKLVVDVISQCNSHYYTEDCSVYCRPNRIHYTCLNNGTKHCNPGWEGPNCMDMIDFCPGNKCQHGATCIPVLLNYTCTCPPHYTGFYCEKVVKTENKYVRSTTTYEAAQTKYEATPTYAETSTTYVPTPTTYPKTSTTYVSTPTTNETRRDTVKSVKSPNSESQKGEGGNSVDVGLAAGLPVGFLLFLLVVCATIFIIIRHKKRSRTEPMDDLNDTNISEKPNESLKDSQSFWLTEKEKTIEIGQSNETGHPPINTNIT